MSFDREDFYDECKGYCQNYELLDLIDYWIDESNYNSSLDKSSLIKLKGFVLETVEFYEKKWVGYILKE